ncbi:IPT/TIG domain-containing protein [Roseateles noduli]|uniref:IPT/TIG domain-containing protein n=1 Tax=Roseateles noduli TaxID=2052484 RepID=UPI003D64671E
MSSTRQDLVVSTKRGVHRGMRRGVLAGGWGAVALALLMAGWSAARATGYVYDDLGRLVQVVLPNGSGTQYVYDAAGNITAVRAVNAGTLSITSFTPESGAPGSKLTVNGSGFATSIAGNTVTVGGASAIVTAATASQLTVTVPASAATGPVGVTTGGSSVTSAKPFTVVSSKTPTIASFTPVLGTTGTVVTLTGTNIQTTASDNRLLFNTSGLATLSAATATTLTTKVPSVGSSGRLTLSTPYGNALSTADFLAVPDNRTPSNVAAWTRIAVGGAGATLGIPAAGKHAAVIFDGTINQLVTLDTSGSTLGGALGYAVYGPQGTQLATGSVSASQPQAYLPTLTAAGTYAVFFDAGAAATLKVAATVDQSFAIDAGRTTIRDVFPGQTASVPFTGTAGQNLGLSLSGLTFTGTGATAAVTLQVAKPDGTVWQSNTSCVTANPGAACELNLSGLPVSGAYAIRVLNPAGNRPIAAGVLTLSSDKTGTLVDGQVQSLAVRTGQNGRITFAATAGQVATVWLGNHATNPSVDIPVTVLKPDGSSAFTQSLAASVRGGYLTVLAAQSGNHAVFVDPAYGASGNLELVLNPAVTTLTVDGAPASLAASPGAYLVFNGVAGQNLGLGLTGLSFPGGGLATLTVRKPDGSVLSEASCSSASPASGCDLNLSNLPATGLYRVQLISTSAAQPSAATFVLSSDKVTTLTAATPATATLRAGQNGRFTVQGTAGQPMNLWVGQGVSDPAGVSIAVNVSRPDGLNVGSTTLSTSSNGMAFTIPSAPVTGTYTVFVDPGFGAGATVQALSEPVATPVAVDGATVNIAATTGGYGTFTATAGQNLGLGVSGLAFATGVSGTATLRIVQPNGSVWLSATCASANPGGNCEVNLPNVPATGTYRIQLVGNSAPITTANVTLSTDAIGVLPQDGSTNLALRTGQNGRYTIAGTAGQQLTLTFSTLSTTPAGQAAMLTLLDPSGSSVWQSTLNAASVGTGMTPPLLPGTGNYTLFVDPSYGSALTGALLLGNTPVVPLPVDGAPAALGGTKGLYASFTGSAGQNLGLGLTNLTFSGGANSYVSLYVYKPDGSPLVSGTTCYAGVAPCGVNLSRLPTTGNYLVRAVPVGATAVSSLTLTLSSDVSGTLTAGTPRAVTLRSGQNATLSFGGTAGQPVTVRMKDLSTTPAALNVNLSVLRSDGSVISTVSGSTSSDGNQIHVPSLPSTGNYVVFVDPEYGAAAALSVVVDGAGDIVPDGAAVGLPVPMAAGSAKTLQFSGTAGQSVGVGLSGLAGTGYVALELQGPAGASSLTSATCYANSGGTGACGLNLTLPATGSYLIRSRVNGGSVTAGSVTLSNDATGTLSAGTPVALNLRTGQNGRLVLPATAGQPVTLRFRNMTTAPAGLNVGVSLYRPDGVLVTSVNGTTSGDGGYLRVPAMPASGNFIVFVDPETGSAASLSMVLNPAADIAIDGDPVALPVPMAATTGKGLLFYATAGQNLGVGLSGVSSSGGYVVFSVVGGDTGTTSYGQATCYPAEGSCGVNLTGLPAGAYLIRAQAGGGTTTGGTVVLSNDVGGPLTANTLLPLTLRAGQNGRVSFEGTAGQPATLRYAVTSTTPASRNISATLYRPDGVVLTSNSGTVSSDGNQIAVGSLPVNGTYTLLLDPEYGSAASVSVTLNPQDDLIVDGAAVNLPVPMATGTAASLTFKATAGQSLGLGLGSLTGTGSVSLSVQGAAGTIVSANCYPGDGGCGLNLPNLTAGQYLVRAQINGGTITGGAITLSNDVGGALSTNTPMPLTLRAGQNGRMTFAGTAGQPATLRYRVLSTSPGVRNVYATLYRPDGSSLTFNYGSPSSDGSQIHVASLPTTGTYTLVLDPDYGVGASVTTTLNPADDIVVDGAAVNLPAPMATGTAASLTFKATAGQSLGLGLGSLTGTGSVSLSVQGAAGTIVSANCYPGDGGCGLNLPNLTAGQYLVRAQINGGTITGGAITLSNDVGGALSTNTPMPLTLRAGQNGRMTFAGTAGQPATLRYRVLSTSPGVRNVYATLYRPDGSSLTFNYGSPSSDGSQIHVASLPTTGTYTLVLDPDYGVGASVTTTLNPADDIVVDGAAVNLPAPMATGTAASLTFKATAGQSLGLGLGSLTGTGSVSLSVQGAAGTIVSANCYPGDGGCGLNLPNLTAGQYLVRAQINGGTITGGAITLSNDVGGALSTNTPMPLTLRAGQNGRMTFAGTAGQPATLRYRVLSTSPGVRNVYATLYRPDGSSLTFNYGSPSSDGSQIHVASLPTTGTYTLVLDPDYGVGASVTTTLNPPDDIVVDGAAVNLPAPMAAGTVVSYVFRATAGQNLGLGVSGLATTGTANLSLQGPNGSSNNRSCYGGDSGCEMNLRNAVAGSYLIRFQTNSSTVTAGAVTLSNDAGGALTAGTPKPLSLRAGQNGLLTFTGTAGQPATLRYTVASTTPVNRTIYATLYRPDGTLITTASGGQANDGSQIYVASLPTNGTYTLVLDPQYGAAATMTATLNPADDIVADGASVNLPVPMAVGSAASYVFKAMAGQNLGLGVSGLATTGTANVIVQGPDGNTNTRTCYGSDGGCEWNLTNTMAGSYLIRFQANGTSVTAGTATLSSDVTGTMVVGTPYPLTVRHGQNGRLTVTVPAGARSLVVGTPSTTPTGKYVLVQVLNASGSIVASSNYSTSGGTLSLGTLAAGTYTVVVDPSFGASASVTLTMQ